MPNNEIYCTSVNLHGLTLDIRTRRKIVGLEDLNFRTGHLMISIKNRLFNTNLIESFCRLASEHLSCAYITVVDTPYIHNVEAITTNHDERQRKVDNVIRLSAERTRHVMKILRRHPHTRLRLLPWSDLVSRVPAWITKEITQAYQRNGTFRSMLVRHCREIQPSFDIANNPTAFERFLVEEIPPILYAYYLLDGGVVDFYPGPNPPFFWEIDLGRLASELPRITEMASKHMGISYVEFGVIDNDMISSATV